MKGKPWAPEQEKKLRELFESKVPLKTVAAELGLTEQAVKIKCERFGLVEVGQTPTQRTTTSIVLPKELFRVEEALKMLAGALKVGCERGLDKVEVQRLQVVSTIARAYIEKFAEYVDYRRIEKDLVELRKKYEELAKKEPPDTQPK